LFLELTGHNLKNIAYFDSIGGQYNKIFSLQ